MPGSTPDYFERGYAQRWPLEAPGFDLRVETAGIWRALQLSRGSRLVDVGCGHGKHALALAERGADVVAIDAAASLLQRGREIASARVLDLRWLRADMRKLPLRAGVADAAILMDAFGFFETDQEHATVIREIAKTLKPGGRLLAKVLNGVVLMADFRQTEREEHDGVVVAISNTLAFGPARLSQRIRIRGARGDGEYLRRQRLFGVDEMRQLFRKAGLEVTGVFAGPHGESFAPAKSPAIWMTGQR